MSTPQRGASHPPARRPLVFATYRLLSHAIAPWMPRFLEKRRQRGKEDGARIGERTGIASQPRPDGTLIWLHAASVGETVSILPLVERLVGHGSVLLTTGTVTSAALAAKRLPPGAIHQFVPVDLATSAKHFLDHWRPDLAVFTESELWPNLMFGCHERGIPMGIVNGRMSERSFRGWSRIAGQMRGLLQPMAFCLAQSDIDAERYAALGAPASSPGNLKFDVPALPFDPSERARLAALIAGRRVFLAASTHPGEEAIVLDSLARLHQTEPSMLTIIVPRHPDRGADVATLAAARGFTTGRRSAGDMPESSTQVHVADTLGELGLFYGLAHAAFIGGSLVPHGGHNPIEAVKLDAPVITGPHVANFAFVFGELLMAEGAITVSDAGSLADAVAMLIVSPAERERLNGNANRAILRHEGALDRTMSVLLPLLASRDKP